MVCYCSRGTNLSLVAYLISLHSNSFVRNYNSSVRAYISLFERNLREIVKLIIKTYDSVSKVFLTSPELLYIFTYIKYPFYCVVCNTKLNIDNSR